MSHLDQNRSSVEKVPFPALVEEACELAAELLKEAHEKRNQVERSRAKILAGMMEDESGKEMTFRLADQVFHPSGAKIQASVFRRLLREYGVPGYLPWWQQGMMALGGVASRFFPGLVMPAVVKQMRRDSDRVILPREDDPLKRFLASRKRGCSERKRQSGGWQRT